MTFAHEPRLVSLIVRSMDRSTLAQALASVAVQSWPAIEVVVVSAKGDGHGPLPSQCGPFPLRLVSHGTPLNRSAAANAGIDAAQGEWLLFLDDDDWLEPDHIETLAGVLGANPDAAAAYSGVKCVLEEGGGELPVRSCAAFVRELPADPVGAVFP